MKQSILKLNKDWLGKLFSVSSYYLNLLDFIEDDNFNYSVIDKQKIEHELQSIQVWLSTIRFVNKNRFDNIKIILAVNNAGRYYHLTKIHAIRYHDITLSEMHKSLYKQQKNGLILRFSYINLNKYIYERTRNYYNRLKEQNSNS